MVRRWRAARPWGRAVAIVVAVVVLAGVGTGVWWFTGRDKASAAAADGAATTTTVSAMADAKKAAEAGDFDKAVAASKHAEELAKASIYQSQEQKDGWKQMEIR